MKEITMRKQMVLLRSLYPDVSSRPNLNGAVVEGEHYEPTPERDEVVELFSAEPVKGSARRPGPATPLYCQLVRLGPAVCYTEVLALLREQGYRAATPEEVIGAANAFPDICRFARTDQVFGPVHALGDIAFASRGTVTVMIEEVDGVRRDENHGFSPRQHLRITSHVLHDGYPEGAVFLVVPLDPQAAIAA
jgi:hypothetical protein